MLRSWISFSVITVTLCGMSRNSWLPLPISVRVARNWVLLWVAPSRAESCTVTVGSVAAAPAGGVAWAKATELSEPASSMAPSGNRAVPPASVMIAFGD